VALGRYGRSRGAVAGAFQESFQQVVLNAIRTKRKDAMINVLVATDGSSMDDGG